MAPDGRTQGAGLFTSCYDSLFARKNYAREADRILSIAGRVLPRVPGRILEIGCGTGSHTVEFAKRRVPLTAVDIDGRMLSLARKKLGRIEGADVSFFHGPVEKLPEKNFGLALALFNVVTYIPDRLRLDAFFRAVHERLAPAGLFVFDCWNGVAAILDPPGKKRWKVRHGGGTLHCLLASRTDFFRQTTTLTYRLRIIGKDGKEKKRGEYSFEQFLWTPREIGFAIEEAGFSGFSCIPAFEPDKAAGPGDWKIMFICRK
jgi:SAM-dependent methyltransferase